VVRRGVPTTHGPYQNSSTLAHSPVALVGLTRGKRMLTIRSHLPESWTRFQMRPQKNLPRRSADDASPLATTLWAMLKQGGRSEMLLMTTWATLQRVRRCEPHASAPADLKTGTTLTRVPDPTGRQAALAVPRPTGRRRRALQCQWSDHHRVFQAAQARTSNLSSAHRAARQRLPATP